MAKSKRWSLKDIRVIKKYILQAKNEGMEESVGLKAAATHFGITLNAVRIRWGRYNQGENISDLNKGTTKIPVNRKKRKYTKKEVKTIHKEAAEEVESFSQKQSMTRELRKMVIDLMNTSGQIKAVSVDLSNRSFTVIY